MYAKLLIVEGLISPLVLVDSNVTNTLEVALLNLTGLAEVCVTVLMILLTASIVTPHAPPSVPAKYVVSLMVVGVPALQQASLSGEPGVVVLHITLVVVDQ